MAAIEMPRTPTLDRMKEVHEQSQAIGEFLEWLHIPEEDGGPGLFVARWDRQRECNSESLKGRWSASSASGFVPDWRCAGGQIVDQAGEILHECEACDGTGMVDLAEPRGMPAGESIERLLARFYGIDLDAAERERMAVLAAVRRAS